jgi:hypothetical protein
MNEAINNIRREDYESEEAYLQEVTRITNHYKGMWMYTQDELMKSIDNSKTFYESDWNAYNEKTGYKISKDIEWRDTFAETEISLITGYTNIDSYRASFETNTITMVNNLVTAFGNWKTATDQAF